MRCELDGESPREPQHDEDQNDDAGRRPTREADSRMPERAATEGDHQKDEADNEQHDDSPGQCLVVRDDGAQRAHPHVKLEHSARCLRSACQGPPREKPPASQHNCLADGV